MISEVINMKISGLDIDQEIIVQVTWGERKIEFPSIVREKADMSIVVTPYMHNNSPLELNIDNSGKVVCNIFADSPESKERISWKNVSLATIDRNGTAFYEISTKSYNAISSLDDRRENERIEINKKGRVFVPDVGEYYDVVIYDISDVGISFTLLNRYDLPSHRIFVLFEDCINDKEFNMRVECKTIRSKQTADGSFWGCKTSGENKDFLLYSLMQRLMSRSKYRAMGSKTQNIPEQNSETAPDEKATKPAEEAVEVVENAEE